MLGDQLLSAGAYFGVSAGMLALAYFVLDWLTPGRLGERVASSRSGGVYVSASLLGMAAILVTAIWTNGSSDTGTDLLWTVAFGGLGIAAQTLGFYLWDKITPGELADSICEESGRVTPLAFVASALQIALSALVIVSIVP